MNEQLILQDKQATKFKRRNHHQYLILWRSISYRRSYRIGPFLSRFLNPFTIWRHPIYVKGRIKALMIITGEFMCWGLLLLDEIAFSAEEGCHLKLCCLFELLNMIWKSWSKWEKRRILVRRRRCQTFLYCERLLWRLGRVAMAELRWLMWKWTNIVTLGLS